MIGLNFLIMILQNNLFNSISNLIHDPEQIEKTSYLLRRFFVHLVWAVIKNKKLTLYF